MVSDLWLLFAEIDRLREAVEAEREECAVLHDSIDPYCDDESPGKGAGAMGAILRYRDAIRARQQGEG